MQKKLKDISFHLLDLGKRNRLLNYKETGFRTVEVLNNNMDVIFNKVTSSASLSIYNIDSVLAKYNKTIDGTKESVSDYSSAKIKDIVLPLLKNNDVLCYKKGTQLSKVFKIIYKEYKQTILEKGINTLYMTFGLVEYTEKNDRYYAPLLLIPLNIDYNSLVYKVREYDDEIIVNPTFAYLLKSEYKITLPEFVDKESEINSYFKEVKSILAAKKMELIPHMSIGIYSFLKMNMFNDLTANEETVLQNKNILRLLDSKVENDTLSDNPIYPVVNADSSQIDAIKYAASGASFVLQGPPGSGKSQTITNIIASVIGNGKKVLFVSEKQAALNVVYENLRRAGIESFALELHSHKANKKEFIDELYKTAILPRYDVKNDAKNVEQKYNYLVSKLNDYRNSIHQVIPRLNLSMYDVYSYYLNTKKADLNYQIKNIEKYDILYLEKVKELFKRYERLSESLSYDYHEGPFYGFTSSEINYIRYDAKKDLLMLQEFFMDKVNVKKQINSYLPINIISYQDLVNNIDFLDNFVKLNHFLPDYFIKRKRSYLLDALEKYLKAQAYINKSTLSNFFNLDIIKFDPTRLLYDFKLASGKAFKFLSLKYHRLKKNINMYAKLKMKDKDLILKLEEANEYLANLTVLNENKKELPKGFRHYEYEAIYKDLLVLEKIPFDLNLTEEKYFELKKTFIDVLIHFNSNNSLSLIQYMKIFDSEIIDLVKGDLEFVSNRLTVMVKSLDLLDLHAQRLDILKQIREYDCLEFLDNFLKEKLDLKDLAITYQYLFYQENIFYEVENNPILKEFSGLGIDSLIEEFKKLDLSHLEANKAYIVSKLSKLRPDDSIMVGSKFSILVKEYNKSRKQKPIRVLLEEIFELALDIKPVFLMSPLSVSTYLNSRLDLFDLVIFDEASQVFAWDALGAIYRAKQCIIIGDSKQMPPSNFFNTTLNDEDESEDYENDLESILDKGSSVFTTKRLNWHYRSRSEELIAFSNKEFYDSRLITIPQAKMHCDGFGIDFNYLEDGVYEVKSRTNQKEAEYITDLVFRYFDSNPNQSMGVVAFSNAQADLISSLIDDRLQRNPEYRKYFNEDCDEPFFVKNLESVQGDERDRIIFSICYGYNKDKKFYQRFGPLNNVGGERRLNVAITRAKFNICVVSSIRSRDIKTENTASIGVKLLKDYLDYIENITTPKRIIDSERDGVVDSIASYLTEQGFLVHKKIGSSEFKIDIAVMHPITKEYVVAIMLDGPSYKIGNCSDANRLQELLLERLGWQYFRIFSTLWVNQEKLEKEKLNNFLNQVFSNSLPKEKKNEIERSYLVEDINEFDSSFAKYPLVTDAKIKELYENKKPHQIIKYIVSKEEPIHIDFLLKRICFMYGRTKVTNIVKQLFDSDMEKLDLIVKDGFLMTKYPDFMSLRIPSERSIDQIYITELEDAIYKITKNSNGITKEGCFKNVVKLLGYTRMTDNAVEYLEKALVFLKLDGKIVEKQDCLYV